MPQPTPAEGMSKEDEEYFEMELSRMRNLKSSYVNSGIATSLGHNRWLARLRDAGHPLAGEPSRPSDAGQPSASPVPATPVPVQSTTPNEKDVTKQMVKLYSPAKKTWWPLTAKLDSGTTENWISAHVVYLLELKVQTVPAIEYVTFTGEKMVSTEVVEKIHWCGDGVARIQEMNFRVAHKAPFDVLIGSDLIFAKAIFSFNEANLILTKQHQTEGSTASKEIMERNRAAIEAEADALNKQRESVKYAKPALLGASSETHKQPPAPQN
ncbi:hypothetical protein MMC30_003608 [Trapelia coarctata]|nr:hypothetical protein [Trapelia coarctata]